MWPTPVSRGSLSCGRVSTGFTRPSGGSSLNLAKFGTVFFALASAVLVAAAPVDATGTGERGAPAGRVWSFESIPQPAGGFAISLDGIACEAVRCVAVGTASHQGTVPLIGKRTASSWASSTLSVRGMVSTSGLDSVSCTSLTQCVAVGASSSANGHSRALAEVWDGTSWKLAAADDRAGAAYNDLSSVSCRTSMCEAVGFASPARFADTPIAESWNKKTWTLQTTALPPRATSGTLNGVACTSASRCVAVGQATTGTTSHAFIETWDGSHWQAQWVAIPLGAIASFLRAVSCVSASACLTVGSYVTSGGNSAALAERWNGATWTLLSPLQPGLSGSSHLEGVDCVSTKRCVAVGTYSTSTKDAFALVEYWSGSAWSVETASNPPGALVSDLHAVSCTSSLLCVTVGSYTASNSTGPFALSNG